MRSNVLFARGVVLATVVFAGPLSSIGRELALAAAARPVDQTAGRMGLPDGALLLTLEPLLRFERVVDEVEFDVSDAERQQLKTALTESAHRALAAMHVNQWDGGERSAESMADMLRLSSRLARGHVTDEARTALAQLAAGRERLFVLAQLLRVKEGPGSAWEPATGAIRSAISSAELHAAVISCANGAVVWRNATVIRNRPRPDDRGFLKELDRFFSTAHSRTEQRRKSS